MTRKNRPLTKDVFWAQRNNSVLAINALSAQMKEVYEIRAVYRPTSGTISAKQDSVKASVKWDTGLVKPLHQDDSRKPIVSSPGLRDATDVTKLFEPVRLHTEKIDIKLEPKMFLKRQEQKSLATPPGLQMQETFGFGTFSTSGSDSAPAVKTEGTHDPCMLTSIEQIKARQVPTENLEDYPVFKKYERGAPTSRLYVKNVAKNVSEAELRSIFENFVDLESEIYRNSFDVRLLTSGRMRGQAFVALGSTENALRAIEATNGLLLGDKPIVVSFARSKPG